MAIERYGPIDLASAHWANQSKWIVMLPIPKDMFPNWKVLNLNIPVHAIACNQDIYGPLWAALQAVKRFGLEKELKTFDGCFNIRAVRGSDLMSTHAYGFAFAKWSKACR